jgi:hypothetical protein
VTETCTVRSNGSSPLCTRLQNANRVLNDEIAFQQFAAEASAGDFDLLGQRDFLLPREQRNFAHLREVHADRVVRPRFVVVGDHANVVALQVGFRFGVFGYGDDIIVFRQLVDGFILVDEFRRFFYALGVSSSSKSSNNASYNACSSLSARRDANSSRSHRSVISAA